MGRLLWMGGFRLLQIFQYITVHTDSPSYIEIRW